MPRHKLLVFALVLTLASTGSVFGGDWPAWRGPRGTGVADEKNVPLKWSQESNIAWKAELPGEGNSTPIVWGDKVFVSCASDKGRLRSLLCFSKQTGEQLWAKSVHYPKAELTHDTNPFCSSSPVTDGERVIVWHGSAGIYCYDLDGREQWKKDLGQFEHIWGNASSPVIYKDLVILNAGPGLRTFLLAMKKDTGEEVWRRDVEDATSQKVDEFRGSWSTPVLYQEKGRDLMALSMPKHLIAFDPLTGETVWQSTGLSLLAYTSPLVSDEAIIAMSGYHGPAIAVRPGGMGDVTETHRLWQQENKNPQRVGSGVLVDGHVYIFNEDGIAWCLSAVTGERKWEKRLGGRSWSSMSCVDGRIYAMNMDGTTFVLEVNPNACKVLAENHLDEMVRSSHAFSDGRIFIRTYRHLWCIAESKE
jgi:outer membrane protein assembly factor BamB